MPAERSTGETVRRTGLTLASNRRVPVGAALSYRHPARVSETLRVCLEALPKIRDIAPEGASRIVRRYRRLSAAGKKLPVIIAATAWELAAFLSAIGRQIRSAATWAVHSHPAVQRWDGDGGEVHR